MHPAKNIEEGPFVPYYTEDEDAYEVCWHCHCYLVGPPGRKLCHCPQPEPVGGAVREDNRHAADPMQANIHSPNGKGTPVERMNVFLTPREIIAQAEETIRW